MTEPLVLRVDVEAHQDRGEVLAAARGALLCRRAGPRLRQVEVGAVLLGRRGLVVGVVGDRLEADQRGAGLDLAPGRHQELTHPRRERRPQHRLHLHALEHQHRSTGVDQVADGHRGGHDQSRGRRAQHASLVAADPVGDAVDLDQVDRPVGGGHQPVDPVTDRQPGVELVEPLDVDVDHVRGACGGDGDPEPVRAGLQHRDLVRRAAQLEVDRPADLVLHLGPAAVGTLEQPGDLDLLLVLVGLDARGDDGDPGVLVDDEAPLAAGPVDPAGVGPAGLSVDHLGLVEEVEDEALVGGAALDHHGGLGHRATEPRQRLVAGAAVGDDLGDHRVEVGRDGVALADAGVDADAGPRGQVEQRDPAGRRGEVAVRVLGVQPGLDGVPLLRRLRPFETAAGRDVQLRLDQVEVRRRLGDRVLDLQAGVDLEEGERPLARVVEELDRPGADVPDGDRQPLGGRLELLGLARVEQGRRRLLDHLLVAPLHGAVADADRPRRAMAVGDQLDLDVPCPGHQALQEDHAAAEGALGLVAGALVGVLELGSGVDPADAPATSASSCLEHERVADPLGCGQRLVQRVDAASAPRRDRHPHLLGEELGADLVAKPAHRVGARTDEGHAEALAQVRERGVLRDEPPPDPDRVCRALDQRPLEDGQVDVGAGRGGTQRVGLVRLPREHRRTFLVGVERDRADRLPTALRVQVADGVDQPHRGLAAVHDRNSRKHP